ncbi:hypothetical protein ACFE04_011978 [Oxalis oulophora]
MNKTRDPNPITRFEEESEEIESSSESESESESEEKSEIERVLADVTFGELQKARSDGTHHMLHRKPIKENKSGGRANKNRPMEASSKKPVGRFREIVQVPKKVVRDPRFESLSGNLDVGGFKKRFSFLFEDSLPSEKEKLKKQLKKIKDPNQAEEVKNQLTWINKQLKLEAPKSAVDSHILAEHKKKEREAAKQGKKPYYLKKSDIKKQKLTEKYNELKAAGKLDSYIENRRKKNAAKDRRFMPYRRDQEE